MNNLFIVKRLCKKMYNESEINYCSYVLRSLIFQCFFLYSQPSLMLLKLFEAYENIYTKIDIRKYNKFQRYLHTYIYIVSLFSKTSDGNAY